jgi:hypothetical protein
MKLKRFLFDQTGGLQPEAAPNPERLTDQPIYNFHAP